MTLKIISALTPLRIITCFFFLCTYALPGCLSKNVALDRFEITPEAYSAADVYQSMTIDGRGMPKYEGKLKKIPDAIGSTFVLVFKDGKNRPSKALSMMIVKHQEKADPSRSITVIFDWTKKGFLIGTDATGSVFGGSVPSNSCLPIPRTSSGGEALGYLALIGVIAALTVVVFITPIIVGTTGGFVVGVAQSPVEATGEIKKALTDRIPLALVYLSYHYEGAGRLVGINQYIASNPAKLVVETEYHYRPFEFIPYKAVVKSIPEKKTRTIIFP
ncbi:MAG TPA: hypothetical protein PKM65_08500 [Spirochaetota bacterium]|nr:hypothetical protein [Spirochaetota bacterium]HNT12532.1 hypothetical protein [Spirochaetota bacterium]